MAHYDYWSDSLKHSILLDSQADIISYGMGEKSIVEIADALNSGIDVKDLSFIAGTVYKTKDISSLYDYELLPSYNEMLADKILYAKSFRLQHENTDAFNGKTLVEPYPMVFMLCRIYHRNRFRRRRWMMSMRCHIRETITHHMSRREAFLRYLRSSFP